MGACRGIQGPIACTGTKSCRVRAFPRRQMLPAPPVPIKVVSRSVMAAWVRGGSATTERPDRSISCLVRVRCCRMRKRKRREAETIGARGGYSPPRVPMVPDPATRLAQRGSAMNRSHIARAKAIRNLVTERGKGDGNCRPYSAQPIAACYRGTRAERTTRRVHRGQTWLPLQVSFPFTVCSIPYEIEKWNFSTRKTRARHTHLSKSPPLPGTKGTVTSPACAVL